MSKYTYTDHSKGVPPYAGVIVLGNSGVGKSWLCNIIILNDAVGKDRFHHDYAPGAVTTHTESFTSSMLLKEMPIDLTIYNVPGLVESDRESIMRNKTEIEKAFQSPHPSYIIYVFDCSSGRLREEDIQSYRSLKRAFDFDDGATIFVLNRLKRKLPPDYEKEAKELIQNRIGVSSPQIAHVPFIDPGDEEGKKACHVTIIQMIEGCTPKIHKSVTDIVTEQERLASQLAWERAQQRKIEKKREDLVMRPKRVLLRTYHGTYVRACPNGVVDTQVHPQEWEMFTLVWHGDTFNIKSHHGSYVRAYPGVDSKVDLAPHASTWEVFRLAPAPLGGRQAIQSVIHGSYIRAFPGAPGSTINTAPHCREWECFNIHRIK